MNDNDPTPGSADNSFVAPSDIAEMAGVSRAAVSNWRKRNDDFPQDVGGTPSKPLFSRPEVVAWLQQRGYKVHQDRGEGLVWAALNALRDTLRPDESADLLLSLACVRKLSAEDSSPVWDRLRNAPPDQGLTTLAELAAHEAHRNPRWARLVSLLPGQVRAVRSNALSYVVDILDQVDLSDLAEVVDASLAKMARAKVREGLEHGFVESRTSAALASLAVAHGGNSIYDPSCGVASALIGAVTRGLQPKQVVGHDINLEAATQAAQRCYLHGIDADIRVADVLGDDPDPELHCDTVIAEPPFGLAVGPAVHIADRRWRYGMPPKSAGDTLWLQHALAHLADGGRGFVVTSTITLARSGADRAVRTGLLRDGCVEAIVALPPRMLPHVGVNLVLWVLRPSQSSGQDAVQFLDLTEAENVEARIGDLYKSMASGASVDEPHRVVDVRDILAADADLTVQRWVQVPDRDPSEVAGQYAASWKQLYNTVAAIEGSSGSLRHFAGTTDARVFTVGDLIDQGVLEVRPGRVIPREVPDELQHRVVSAKHVTAGKVDDVEEEDDVVPSTLAGNLTREGDVLVNTMHRVRAVLDASGGHLPASGVYRVRVLDPAQVSPAYLALVLSGSWNDRFQGGSTIQRADLKLLEIPLVPKSEQANVQLADTSAQLLLELSAQIHQHATEVRASMLDALRYNVPLDGDL